MKYLFAILFMGLLFAIPPADAAFHFQGYSSGLVRFDGPMQVSLSGSDYRIAFAQDQHNMRFSHQTPTSQSGLAFSRPITVQNHWHENPNLNFRTVETGPWQLDRAGAHFGQSQFAVNRNPMGELGWSANINNNRGPLVSPVAGRNAFAPPGSHPFAFQPRSSVPFPSTGSATVNTWR